MALQPPSGFPFFWLGLFFYFSSSGRMRSRGRISAKPIFFNQERARFYAEPIVACRMNASPDDLVLAFSGGGTFSGMPPFTTGGNKIHCGVSTLPTPAARGCCNSISLCWASLYDCVFWACCGRLRTAFVSLVLFVVVLYRVLTLVPSMPEILSMGVGILP